MNDPKIGVFAMSDLDPEGGWRGPLQEKETRSWRLMVAQNRLLQGLLDCLDAAIFSVDVHYCYTSFNTIHAATMKAIYGAEIEVGKSLLDYQSVDEDRISAKKNLDLALGGELVVVEAFSGSQAAARKFFSIAHHPLQDEEGRCLGVLVIAKDITEQNRAQDALERSERRYRALFEQAGVGVVEVESATGRFLRVNQRFCDLLAYSREELLQSNLQRITHPEDLEPSLESLKGLGQGRHRDAEIEKRFVRKDGGIVWASVQVTKLMLGGEYSGTNIGIIRDITDQKETEQRLKASEDLHHSLFANMLNGFALCRMLYDEDGRPQDFVYVDVNGAFETLTGLKEVVGKQVSEVIPGLRVADSGLFEIYGRVARGGPPERFETYVAAMDMWFSISVYSPKRDHFVAVFDVITDRKRAEESVRAQLGELRRWHEATLGRESRILELKQEVNELLALQGRPPKYGSTGGSKEASDGMPA